MAADDNQSTGEPESNSGENQNTQCLTRNNIDKKAKKETIAHNICITQSVKSSFYNFAASMNV